MSTISDLVHRLTKKYPLTSERTIVHLYYNDCNKDITLVEENARRINHVKLNQEKTKYLAEKYNKSVGSIVATLRDTFKTSVLTATDEEMDSLAMHYYKKYAVPSRIHSICNELHISYRGALKHIRNRGISIRNIKTDKDLQKVETFIRNDYIRTARKLDNGVSNLKFELGEEYTGFLDFKRKNNLTLSSGSISNIYYGSGSKEEFLQRVKEIDFKVKNYTKERFEEVNKRIESLGKKYNLSIHTILSIYMTKYFGIIKRDLIDHPELFDAIEMVIKEKSRKNK